VLPGCLRGPLAGRTAAGAAQGGHYAVRRDRETGSTVGPLIVPLLEPGESLLDAAVIQPTAGVQADGVYGPVATRIARTGAVRGGDRSMARGFPIVSSATEQMVLGVTDRRVTVQLVPVDRSGAQPLWVLPRSAVVGVERRRRSQLMAKFRLHFADGSSVSIMTMRRGTIESLADHLGRVANH